MSDNEQLGKLRTMMDRLDADLVKHIANRYTLATEILRLKQSMGLPLHAPDRELHVLRNVTTWARSMDLSEDLVQALFWLMLAHPLKQFEKI